MGVPVKKLRGITDAIAAKLAEKSLTNSDKFLDVAKTPAGRKALATDCGVDTKIILELANRADLARIKGVAGVFGDLLEAAGVVTVKELRNRRADNLHAKMVEVNATDNLAGRNATMKEVEGWVAQAKELPPMIEY
jgi:predicted flap endonuclease-1-like 5' DNA nuclease